MKENKNKVYKKRIMNHLDYFLTHTNYLSHFEIEVKYDPEHDEKPIGTIKVDGAEIARDIEFPDPYNK